MTPVCRQARQGTGDPGPRTRVRGPGTPPGAKGGAGGEADAIGSRAPDQTGAISRPAAHETEEAMPYIKVAHDPLATRPDSRPNRGRPLMVGVC